MLGVGQKITLADGTHVGTLLVDVDGTGAVISTITNFEEDPPETIEVEIRKVEGGEQGDFVILEKPGLAEVGRLFLQPDGSAVMDAPGLFSANQTNVER